MQQKRDFFIDALHIFVLFSFAFAQPIFDLLSQHAEFFVTRHSKPVDIILLIFILCVLLPALVVLIEVVAGLFGRRARKGVHGFMVATLLTVIALPALEKLFEFPGTALIGGAVILGVAFTIAYIRFHPVRMFLTVLSPALLIFPCLFIFNSPVYKVVFVDNKPQAVYAKVDATAPVIVVVLDEFPVTSLMDEHRQIDPVRYPNFTSLARDVYWFRNATTVAEGTMFAVPAILTGLEPKDSSLLPTADDYPHNLFTLLGGSYKMKVIESHTMLCPETLCERYRQTFVQRMYSMLSDLSIVYLHIVLPSYLTTGLPVVTQTWKNFSSKTKAASQTPDMEDVLDRARASYKDRSGLFTQFVQSVTATDEPTLYFIHVMLPHVPWEYLPSGKRYTEFSWELPGLNIKAELWGDDEWLIIQGYQRHLLQVGFVDKLIGDLLTRLRALKLYNRSLIVITADHGVNFIPNKSRRSLEKTDPMNIMSVPLFIKAPNQHERIISDRNVESIDILPTIADILDISLPWPVDGHSAVNSSLSERKEKKIYNYKAERIEFDANLKSKYSPLERKIALFGSGTDLDGLYRIGPHSELIGQYVSKIKLEENASVLIQLNQEHFFENVDSKNSFIPAQITGRVFPDMETPDILQLALAVNGTILAVTQTYYHGNEMKFSAIVPESAFSPGKNRVEVFTVFNRDGLVSLARTKSRSTATFSLAGSRGQDEKIISSEGITIPVERHALRGYLGSPEVKNDLVYFTGWAADIKNSHIPETIVVFVDGKFFYSGQCNANRPDVVKVLGNAAFLGSGFKYMFPLRMFKNIADSEVRIFAVSKEGVASELHYPKGYKWDKKS